MKGAGIYKTMAVIAWMRRVNPKSATYHPAKACKIYDRHKAIIDAFMGWHKGTREEDRAKKLARLILGGER